jgi:hypothetical protein
MIRRQAGTPSTTDISSKRKHVQTVLKLLELQDTCVLASSAHQILLRFLSTILADLPSAVVEFLMRVAQAAVVLHEA